MLHTCVCISVNTITLESSILRMYGCYTPLTVRSRSLCVVNMVVNVAKHYSPGLIMVFYISVGMNFVPLAVI